jgi:acetolactate synthase regulatory subunit
MKKRVVVQMEEETDKYCQQQAEMLGISKSGFINVVVAQYRQQNTVLDQLPNMLKKLQDVQSIEKLLITNDKDK